METYNASVVKEGEHWYLQLSVKEKVLKIALTKDNPNEIKNVFNELIVELKKGKFKFNYVGENKDLFSQVSNEYLTQLNKELVEVYNELESFNLL
ncbi:MAG: hypothetical protein Q8O13_10940 [Candidatus Omnitrophota bacterium]|nr:hypothetical protein [Candidatus Omnitrophota bacterium]